MNWERIPTERLRNSYLIDDSLTRDLLHMIQFSYAPKGGYPDFETPGDIPGSHDEWRVLFDGGVPVAVMFGKLKRLGIKWTGIASNGSMAAKAALLTYAVAQFSQPGNFVELDDYLSAVFSRRGVRAIEDRSLVEQALDGRPVTWLNDKGRYTRVINGSFKIKTLMGCLPEAARKAA